MLLLLGALDFGRAFNYWIDQTHIANEGSRWAVVHRNPDAGSGLALQKYLQQLIPFMGKAASNLTGLKLRAESTMRLEQVPSNHSLGAGTSGTCPCT